MTEIKLPPHLQVPERYRKTMEIWGAVVDIVTKRATFTDLDIMNHTGLLTYKDGLLVCGALVAAGYANHVKNVDVSDDTMDTRAFAVYKPTDKARRDREDPKRMMALLAYASESG